MKKNRRMRYRSHSSDVKVVACVSMFIFIIAVGAIVNLSLGNRISKISSDISVLENERESLRKDEERETHKWAQVTDPDNLRLLLNRHGLHMEASNGDRIVSLRGMRPVPYRSGQSSRAIAAK